MLEPGSLRDGAVRIRSARKIPISDMVQVGGDIIGGENEKHTSCFEIAELEDERCFGFGGM